MKKVILIILAMFVVTAGIVYAVQNKQTESKGALSMNKKVLVAYFSRTGEQYSVGNIKKGNTAIIAEMIANKTGGDLFEIKVAHDNYPKGYTELTEYAKKEMNNNARPEIAGKVNNFTDYDTVFVGYPVWWGDKPMPVYTFLDSYNFNGKTIIPFCTHEGSGYCGEQGLNKTSAKVIKGLAVYGHVAQNDRTKAEEQIDEWLKKIGY